MNVNIHPFVTACVLGDGSLTRILREGRNTTMISFSHSVAQKPWLQAKADRLNEIFERSCTVGERSQFDNRTKKTYGTCQWSLTSKALTPLYDLIYPGKKKTFTKEVFQNLSSEHLAVLWADDGNLEPKHRVGRLNLYEPENQCQVVRDWIESVSGAIGRYEDYERSGVGRLRFPPSEMVKIAVAIAPFLHSSMFYKIDMQYKSNTLTKLKLAASSPSQWQHLEPLPVVSEITHAQWAKKAKEVGVSDTRNKSKIELRACIEENLRILNGR